ncbi:MAG: hypothetical protein PHQ60_06250 [Sideroxydans sp.]|nr:hypothetical protein [Sideroxydans sp.]
METKEKPDTICYLPFWNRSADGSSRLMGAPPFTALLLRPDKTSLPLEASAPASCSGNFSVALHRTCDAFVRAAKFANVGKLYLRVPSSVNSDIEKHAPDTGRLSPLPKTNPPQDARQ